MAKNVFSYRAVIVSMSVCRSQVHRVECMDSAECDNEEKAKCARICIF